MAGTTLDKLMEFTAQSLAQSFLVGLDATGQDDAGLRIVEISDPRAPRETAFLKLKYGAERIWIDGSHAYLAGVANDAGLIIVDVSDPAKPRRLGDYLSSTCSESVSVSGSYAYLAHGDQGLEIIDVSRRQALQVVNHQDAAGKARGIHVVGSTAYLANGYTGLRILDVSDPGDVRELGNVQTDRALDVRVSGSYAYVADEVSAASLMNATRFVYWAYA